jgi:hypothetical protein
LLGVVGDLSGGYSAVLFIWMGLELAAGAIILKRPRPS